MLDIAGKVRKADTSLHASSKAAAVDIAFLVIVIFMSKNGYQSDTVYYADHLGSKQFILKNKVHSC